MPDNLPMIARSAHPTGASPMHDAAGFASQLVHLPSVPEARLERHRRDRPYISKRNKEEKRVEKVTKERLQRSVITSKVHRHSWITRWRIRQYSSSNLRREATEIPANRQKAPSTRLRPIKRSPGGALRRNGNRATWTIARAPRTRWSRFSEAFPLENQ